MTDGFRFGRYEIDADAHELRRDGRRVKLQARPFRILLLLVSRAGSVVTREEIRQHVWGPGTWVDFDHNVSFCIHQVRSALNDDAQASTYVETLPRRGYRFIAAVERVMLVSAHASSSLPSTRSHETPPGSGAQLRSRALAWLGRGRKAAAALALGLLTLGVAVGPRPASLRVPAWTADGQAAYLKGLFLRRSGCTALEPAARALQQAVQLDPRRADGHAALADTWVEIADLGLRPAREALALADREAREALRLDPQLAAAHVALGTAQLAGAWDWEGARRSFTRALAIDPRLVSAHSAWAAWLSGRGDQDGAIAAIRRAQQLDPLCPIVRGEAGWYYYCARRFPEAASEWRKLLTLEPGNAGAHERLVRAYRHAEQIDAALEEARQTLRAVGASNVRSVDLTLFSRGTARWLETAAAPGPDALERRAALYAGVGERERALLTLETACEQRSRYLLRHLVADPDLDELRVEPRFQALLRRVGLAS